MNHTLLQIMGPTGGVKETHMRISRLTAQFSGVRKEGTYSEKNRFCRFRNLHAGQLQLCGGTNFRGVKVADAKGKQADATWSSATTTGIVLRVADRDFVTIPYDQLDKVSYEYTKKHRITQGALVMVASLGAGAVVMMTKSKSHWLYIDYHEQNVPKTIVLRMDKHAYKNIIAAVDSITGKQVQFLGDGGRKKKKKAEPEQKASV